MDILIVMASSLMAQGLKKLIEHDLPGCRPLLPGAESAPPTLILIDPSSLVATPPENWPQAKMVLVDTGLAEEHLMGLLLTHRLDGVLARDTSTELLAKAFEVILGGQVWLSNSKLKLVLHHLEEVVRARPVDPLSRKEREIVKLISAGQKNREIAARLCISEQTVKTHIGRIFRKCKVTSRAQLVPLALRLQTLT
jgi:DNA-binding NarL/FixJ family response regulator